MNEDTKKALLEMEKSGWGISGGSLLPEYEQWKEENEEQIEEEQDGQA